MPRFKLTAQYNFEGIIEAPDQTQAEQLFEQKLQEYYESLESIEITKLCSDCNSQTELDLDGSCFECREDEVED